MKNVWSVFVLALLVVSLAPVAALARQGSDDGTSVKSINSGRGSINSGPSSNKGPGKTGMMPTAAGQMMSRDQLKTLVPDVKQCIKDDRGVECADRFGMFRKHLTQIAIRTEYVLTQARERLMKSDHEDKEETLAELDAALEKVRHALSLVEKEDMTADELKEAARTLKDAWTYAKNIISKVKKHEIGHRLDRIPERVEHAIEVLERVSEKVDNEEAKEKIRATIDRLKVMLEDARINLKNDDVEAANARVKELHHDLKDIVEWLRAHEGRPLKAATTPTAVTQ